MVVCLAVSEIFSIKSWHDLEVGVRFQLNTYGCRAFAVAAPATWNTLSDELQNPDLHSATFRRKLKTFLFRQYSAH